MANALDPDAVLVRAKNHLKHGEFPIAIELLRSLMVLGIDEPRVLETLGVAYSLSGDSEWATSLLQRCIEQAPQRVSAYVNLGAHLTRLRNYQAAVDCLLNALQITQESADVFQNLGVAYQELHDWGRAQAAFRNAIRLKPEFVAAHYRLAQVLWHSKNVAVATSYFRKVLELDPQHKRARQALDEIHRNVSPNRESAVAAAPIIVPVSTSQLASSADASFDNVAPDFGDLEPSAAPSPTRCRPRTADDVANVKLLAGDIAKKCQKLIDWFEEPGAEAFSQFRKQVANGVSERTAFMKAHRDCTAQIRVAVDQYRRIEDSFRRLRKVDGS